MRLSPTKLLGLPMAAAISLLLACGGGSGDSSSSSSTPSTPTIPTTPSSSVYIAGYSIKTVNGKDVSIPCYWKDGIITTFDPSGDKDILLSVAVLGNDIYACKKMLSSGNVLTPGYIKNGNWVSLPAVSDSEDSEATSVIISGSDVYFGGYSRNNDKKMCAGYWKNGNWVGFTEIGNVCDIFVSGKDVYAAGDTCLTKPFGYWKNGSWVSLSASFSPNPIYNSGVTGPICVSGDHVYVSGRTEDMSGIYIPGYWDNGTWVGLPALDATKTSLIYSMTVYSGDIYAAGYSTNSAGVMVPGYWKNGVWNGLPVIDATKSAEVGKLVISGGDIYASGYCTNGSNVLIAGYWENGVWTPLSSLDATKNSVAFDVFVK